MTSSTSGTTTLYCYRPTPGGSSDDDSSTSLKIEREPIDVTFPLSMLAIGIGGGVLLEKVAKVTSLSKPLLKGMALGWFLNALIVAYRYYHLNSWRVLSENEEHAIAQLDDLINDYIMELERRERLQTGSNDVTKYNNSKSPYENERNAFGKTTTPSLSKSKKKPIPLWLKGTQIKEEIEKNRRSSDQKFLQGLRKLYLRSTRNFSSIFQNPYALFLLFQETLRIQLPSAEKEEIKCQISKTTKNLIQERSKEQDSSSHHKEN